MGSLLSCLWPSPLVFELTLSTHGEHALGVGLVRSTKVSVAAFKCCLLLAPSLEQSRILCRFGTCVIIAKRVVSLFEDGKLPRLFIQFTNCCCIGVWHYHCPFFGTSRSLLKRLVDSAVMLVLKNPSFVCVIECILEVLGYLFFTELLLNSVYNGHDSFDVSIKHVPFLQALERDGLVDWNC